MPLPRRVLVCGVIAGALAAPASALADWTVVSFDHRIRSADRAAVEAAGGRALQYRPRDSYVAWLGARGRSRVRALQGVAGVRRLPVRERLSRQLAGTRGVQALVYAPRAQAVRAKLPAARSIADAGGGLAELRLKASAAAVAARLREVLWVGPAPVRLHPEDEGTSQILAGNIADLQPQAGYSDWLSKAGLDGSGVRVTVTDVGVDATHPDLTPRVIKRISYGNEDAAGGHATHVAGIIGGNATALGGMADVDGFLYGLGVAPKVEFVDQNVLAAPVFPPEGNNFEQYTRDALRNGAAIWNASWHTGEGTGAGYLESVRMMDVLVRDGDFETAGAQPFTMVFSAGNAGDDESTLTVPHEAKNIITVAASNSQRIQYELVEPQPSTIDWIAGFSSRGPAVDGRIAPTVTAPGQGVMSSRTTTDPSAADCTLPAETAVARPEPNALPYYAYCSGTSMAAPHVTGAVALITQWWRRAHGGADPSPALSKALLVNTATDVGERNAPNNDEGWGRVNLGALFDPAAQRIYSDQEHVLGDAGSCQGLQFVTADTSKPVRAHLVWTDAPGAPEANPALVNDLDLTLTAHDGTAYLGNAFADGASYSGGGSAPDRLNNVEGVVIDKPTAGYDLVVRAANLPGDGAPGGDGTDQDYALVVSNAVALNRAPAACVPPAPPLPAASAPAAAKPKAGGKKRAAKRRKACRKRARKLRPAKRRRAALRRCARLR